MKHQINNFGFWSGVAAGTATIIYCIVQLLQLYGVINYPMDEKLIYGSSLCIVVPLILEILALHYITPGNKKIWSHAALTFMTLYAVFVTANYVVQLATVIPMTMKGQLGEVRILQQTPHSLFWNFDAIGYIFLGLATLAAIPIFSTRGSQRWVKVAFIAHASVTPFISIVYFYPTYSADLLMLGLPWAVTAPAFMLTLAIYFKKLNKNKNRFPKCSSTETNAARQIPRLMKHLKPISVLVLVILLLGLVATPTGIGTNSNVHK
jgi:hypothetical protein